MAAPRTLTGRGKGARIVAQHNEYTQKPTRLLGREGWVFCCGEYSITPQVEREERNVIPSGIVVMSGAQILDRCASRSRRWAAREAMRGV
jgi:hypothetical protein